jgi:hypothetical protein
MMGFKRVLIRAILSLSLVLAGFQTYRGLADSGFDFGLFVENQLRSKSTQLFGIKRPLDESAPPSVGPYRTPDQKAEDQVLLAKGIQAKYLTREAANHTDMIAFFPSENPTHLITCVESDREVIVDDGDGIEECGTEDKCNPSVQRINLSTGEVETILRGMDRCDGIRTTPWGTILATEETDDGAAYEILNPLTTTEESVISRGGPGEDALITAPNIIAKRTALPTMAWEGLTVLPSGVVIGGDELRPGDREDENGDMIPDSDGGAIFKFLPSIPRVGNSPISQLGESPLVSGSVFAMRVSCVEGGIQYGQGCEVGNGSWVPVGAASAREDADVNGATGYYRPEDLHEDPLFTDNGNPDAFRFCWTSTGRKEASNFAEVMCAVDSSPLMADPESITVVVNRFIEGDPDFNSFDNLAFQPGTGNLFVIEDDDNGSVFACLPDGADRDIESDGCVMVLSVRDSSAEPTGFIFSNEGRTAYLSIQHSNDDLMPLVDDFPTDDVLIITGFRSQ